MFEPGLIQNAAAVGAAFSASLVEYVEALTIVLAVNISASTELIGEEIEQRSHRLSRRSRVRGHVIGPSSAASSDALRHRADEPVDAA
jgi:hypothetical protein